MNYNYVNTNVPWSRGVQPGWILYRRPRPTKGCRVSNDDEKVLEYFV